MDSKETIFTGERVVPGAVESDLWNEHVSRYRYAALFAVNKYVLDIGCGTGYGASMMASVARDVAGFDVSLEAVQYARESYGGRGYQNGQKGTAPFGPEYPGCAGGANFSVGDEGADCAEIG